MEHPFNLKGWVMGWCGLWYFVRVKLFFFSFASAANFFSDTEHFIPSKKKPNLLLPLQAKWMIPHKRDYFVYTEQVGSIQGGEKMRFQAHNSSLVFAHDTC